MKTIARLRYLAVTLALGLASVAFAQTASLKADAAALIPSGGSVTFTAAATYDGQPAALGWVIALPSDWTLVSVSGANAPEISPDVGSTGTLEFATPRRPRAARSLTSSFVIPLVRRLRKPSRPS